MEETQVAEYKSQVSFVEDSANKLQIVSEEDMTKGSDLLNDLNKIEKAIKARKEAVTRPLMEGLASARALFKPLETSYASAKKTIKAKMLDYTVAEGERVEKEKARVTARVEKGTMREDTAVGKLEGIGEAKSSFDGTDSKTSLRTVKKIRIVDEGIIPREYLVPDTKKITDAVLRNKVEIPGVEVYEEKSIVGRSA